MFSSRSSRSARGSLLAAGLVSLAAWALPASAAALHGRSPLDYSTFAGAASSLSLNGTTILTTVAGSNRRVLRLTGAGFRQAGSAWANRKIDVTASFETRFKAYLHHRYADADGIALLIQTAGPRALGGWGGGLGYRGIKPSVAVEFDTYQNVGDPSDNHLAVVLAGDPDRHLAVAESGVPLAGKPFTARVGYDAPTRHLKVYVKSLRAGATEQLIIDQSVDLRANVGADLAWVGFTGSTGEVTSRQDIYSWTVTAPSA